MQLHGGTCSCAHGLFVVHAYAHAIKLTYFIYHFFIIIYMSFRMERFVSEENMTRIAQDTFSQCAHGEHTHTHTEREREREREREKEREREAQTQTDRQTDRQTDTVDVMEDEKERLGTHAHLHDCSRACTHARTMNDLDRCRRGRGRGRERGRGSRIRIRRQTWRQR